MEQECGRWSSRPSLGPPRRPQWSTSQATRSWLTDRAANARADQGGAGTASTSGSAPLSADGVAKEGAHQDRDARHQEQVQ